MKTNNKQKTATATKRQWQLLSELKRNAWTGTTSIRDKLKHAGFEVTLRTIQRDLNQLAERFPIESNKRNPQGWRWKEEAPQQSLPQMSLSEAVAFHLVEENLKQILPDSFLVEMHPWFAMAKSQLASNEQTDRWLNSIRIIPATQPLIGAKIKPQVQNVIYDALIKQRQITASYRPRHDVVMHTEIQKTETEAQAETNALESLQGTDVAIDSQLPVSVNTGEATLDTAVLKTEQKTENSEESKSKPKKPKLKRYTLNPIALVQRGVILYLVATKATKKSKKIKEQEVDVQEQENNIRMFALHRFYSCKLTEKPSEIPPDFNIDAFLDKGGFGFKHPNLEMSAIQVHLVFSAKAGKSLEENRLSIDQVTTTDESGNISVTATVALTFQLVWWLRGFGKGLLSIEPDILANAVYETD